MYLSIGHIGSSVAIALDHIRIESDLLLLPAASSRQFSAAPVRCAVPSPTWIFLRSRKYVFSAGRWLDNSKPRSILCFGIYSWIEQDASHENPVL